MQSSKRKIFLLTYLGAHGAKDIIWKNENESCITGTVVYDFDLPEERQDFEWVMDEDNVPENLVVKLIEYLDTNDLIDIDKVTVDLNKIQLPFCDEITKVRLFDELYNVEVDMVEDGVKVDSYFFHD
jgi:hypothetical protein